MKKVNVEQDLCIMCGACMSIAGDVFGYSSEGYSEVKGDVTEDNQSKVLMAVEACPTGAIKIEGVSNEETSECHCDSCECGDDCECGCECDCEDDCDCDCECDCGCECCGSDEE